MLSIVYQPINQTTLQKILDRLDWRAPDGARLAEIMAKPLRERFTRRRPGNPRKKPPAVPSGYRGGADAAGGGRRRLRSSRHGGQRHRTPRGAIHRALPGRGPGTGAQATPGPVRRQRRRGTETAGARRLAFPTAGLPFNQEPGTRSAPIPSTVNGSTHCRRLCGSRSSRSC